MCRSIKRLRVRDQVATDDEIREAARQFVRKVTGFSKPTARHARAFERAVDDVSRASRRVLDSVAAELASGR